MSINKKQLLQILIFFIIMLGIICAFTSSSNAVTKANISHYTVKTEEKNLSTEKFVNIGTVHYEQPSPVYDFFDESGNLNVVYTSETNVYWAKFNSNMQVVSTVKFPQYYDKSNAPDSMKFLFFNFGNAIYYKGYLYVVYGRQGSGRDNAFTEDTMAVVKYDKQGNIVGKTTLIAAANNYSTDYTDGAYVPFYPSSNCSLTINEKDDTLACFFQTHMYTGHERAGLFFIDINTMEWVSNQYEASGNNMSKYKEVRGYFSSHSMSQRIISTSDGGYLLADQNDASNRGLLITKIAPDSDGNLQALRYKMINFREGENSTYGYNCTHLIPGNLIELSDGYIYIGAMERTLSLEYSYSIDESWDLFVQKYDKDLMTKKTIEDAQMFKTTPISATGTKPTENVHGRLYLSGTEKNYGIKWLTNLNNKKMVIDVNAVKIENDQTVILYELVDLKETSTGGYNYTSEDGEIYYIIIDKNGNIVSKPIQIPNTYLSKEENFQYKNGKIYWTTTQGENKAIKVNVLDIKNPKFEFEDVKESAWYYPAVKYVYENNIMTGISDTQFGPNNKLTRGMLATIIHRMAGNPKVTGISKFSDVKDSSKYYYKAVVWAAENKIVSGYKNGTFGPADYVTREQLAVILYNYAKYKGKDISISNNLKEFADTNKIASYSLPQVKWAVAAGVITGSTDKKTGNKLINPKGNATRADVAAMIQKYCLNIGK